MTVPSMPTSSSESEKEAKIAEEELASIAGGQQISDEQFAVWEAMLKDPRTPAEVRKRISARVHGQTVDGKHYDGSTPT